MSTDSQKITPKTPMALEFKSSTFSVPVLVMASDDLAVIEQQLQEKTNLAPEFFKNSPVVLDLQEINKRGYDIDIIALTDTIRKAGLLPVGIRGGKGQQKKPALELPSPVYLLPNGSFLVDDTKPKMVHAVF